MALTCDRGLAEHKRRLQPTVAVSVIEQVPVSLDAAERARLARLADTLRAAEPAVDATAFFGAQVSAGLGPGPTAVIEDHSAIRLFEEVGDLAYAYRSLLLGGRDDVVLIGVPRNPAFETYCRETLGLGPVEVLGPRPDAAGRSLTRRVLNDIGDELMDLGQETPSDLQSMQETLDRIMTALMAIAGATHESMSRELGWGYFGLGRRIERALLLASLVRSLLVAETDPGVEALLMESTLLAAESLTLYRRRYYAQPEIETALDLLLLDETNPRSLIFQVNALEKLVRDLPGQSARPLTIEMRRVIEASGLLRLADAQHLAEIDSGVRPHLDALLARLYQSVGEASAALTDSYFSHVEGPFQLLDTGTESP